MSIVYIAGLGIIGGSLAKKLKELDYAVFGEDLNPENQGASRLKADHMDNADWLFLCMPPAENIRFLQTNMKNLKPHTFVANCSGVQKKAMEIFQDSSHIHYLGAHPMSGSEQSGYAASDGAIFSGSPLILCPSPKLTETHKTLAEQFFQKLDFGRIVSMSASEHDHCIGLISQLPHVLAASLVAILSEDNAVLAGGSLKDMTRIASFNAPLWAELFTSNKSHLVPIIDAFETQLASIKDLINKEDITGTTKFLEDITQKKSSLL